MTGLQGSTLMVQYYIFEKSIAITPSHSVTYQTESYRFSIITLCRRKISIYIRDKSTVKIKDNLHPPFYRDVS